MAVKAVRRPAIGKWTAYWLSLCLPGMGQLMTGSPWCVPWFAGIVFLWCIVNVSGLQVAAPAEVVFSVLLALLSAEHAKRLLEPSRSAQVGRSKPRVRVRCMEVGRAAVDLRIELFLDRPVDDVWSEMADFARFVCIDPFHDQVIVQAAELRPGVDLILVHRIFGFRFLRFGRLLTWREGHGYAFSDLSARGKRHGFPHVFSVTVEQGGNNDRHNSHLFIRIGGKWTSPWLPRWLGMWWLRYVCHEHARLLRKAL